LLNSVGVQRNASPVLAGNPMGRCREPFEPTGFERARLRIAPLNRPPGRRQPASTRRTVLVRAAGCHRSLAHAKRGFSKVVHRARVSSRPILDIECPSPPVLRPPGRCRG
jgi:hypothetical protein